MPFGFELEHAEASFLVEKGDALDQPRKAFGKLLGLLRLQVTGMMCLFTGREQGCAQARTQGYAVGELVAEIVRLWLQSVHLQNPFARSADTTQVYHRQNKELADLLKSGTRSGDARR